MADTQEAPQSTVLPLPELPGSVREAQEALLGLMEPEEDKPKKEEAQPTEEEESTEETQDESLEEESEEELEAASEEEEAEEDTEETDDGEEEDPLYAVTVNGEEHEVTFDELLRGYSRQSDYTRKTQELSNDRKQMESLQQQYNSEVSTIQAERQQYMESLNQIIANSSAGLDKFANVDWQSLKDTDPIEYVTRKEEFREAQEKVQGMQQEQYHAQQRHAEESKKLRSHILKEEHGKLSAALPEWSEPEKQKKMATEIRDYASGQGFSAEEINSLVDHRSLLVLLKASKYDAMQKADVKSKKIKNKPKVIRAGKGRSSGQESKSKRTAQMKRLQESGHVKDASALFEDFVEL
jgi:hypothetical protein